MANSVRAGGAYVELSLNSERFVRGLATAERRLKNVGRSITALGASVTAFGAAGVAGFLPAIRAASDAQEQMSKFEAVFQDQTNAMKEFADLTAKELGRSKYAIRSFLADSQGLFVPIGFDREQAAELSKTITGLAIDLASFFNVADDKALFDIQGALTGSSELMKKYSVVVNEARVNQELLNQSIDPANATLQQKVLARLSLILKGTADAQGDAVRTAASFANQLKRASGVVQDLAVDVGNALLPTLTKALRAFTGIANAVQQFVTNNQDAVRTVFLVAAGTVALGTALVAVGVAFTAAGIAIGLILKPLAILQALFAAVIPLVIALANPFGILIASIAALSAVIVSKLGLASKAFDFLRERLSALVGDFSVAIEAIGQVLARGDIEAAAKILWISLKFQWDQGIRYLSGKWSEFTGGLVRIFADNTFAIAKVATNVFGAIEETWIKVASSISSIWAQIVTGFRAGLIDLQAFAVKAVVKVKGAFDESIDVEGFAKAIDKGAEVQKSELAKTLNDQLIKNDKQREEALSELQNRNDSLLGVIDKKRSERLSEIDQQEQDSLKKSQQELIKARKEWQDAIKQAAGQRNAQAAGEQQQEDPFAALLAKLGDVGGGANLARDFVSTRAITGGQRASQIFGVADTTAKQQLQVQKQQLDEAKRTRQAVEKNNLAFS